MPSPNRNPGFRAIIPIFMAAPSILALQVHDWSPLWAIEGAVAIGLGIVALRRVRGRMIVAPFAMLLFCIIGMSAGLSLDQQALPPGGLASLCALDNPTLGQMARRHWALLPWMHGLMLLGGTGTILLGEWQARRSPAISRRALCARAAFNLLCNSSMLLGMIMGAWGGASLSGFRTASWGPAAMVTVMSTGMVWGMLVTMVLYRSVFVWLVDRSGRGECRSSEIAAGIS